MEKTEIVEEIQKSSADKDGESTNMWTILPETIVFERLVNTGNYENVRLGGSFKIPPGKQPEKALQEIADFLVEEIQLYLNKKGYASRQFENAKKELEAFKEQIQTKLDPNALEIQKKLVRAQISEIGDQLRGLQRTATNMNYYIDLLYRNAKRILSESNLDLETLGINTHILPEKFKVVVQATKLPSNEDDGNEDEENDHDEDEDEY